MVARVCQFAVNVAVLGVRIYRVIEAGIQIYHDCTRKDDRGVEERVTSVALNSIMIAGEVAGGVGHYAGRPALMAMGVGVAAGADIGRSVNRLCWKGERINSDDILELVGVIALRVSVVADTAFLLNVSGFSQSTAKHVSEISGAISAAIQNKQIIGDGFNKAWKGIETILGHVKTVAEEDPSELDVAIELNREGEPALAIDHRYANMIQTVKNTDTIEEFREIPELFLYDPVLGKYICPITGKPIRFIVSLRDGTGKEVHYERQAINPFFIEKRSDLPPEWIDGIPIERGRLVENPALQHIIDHRLNVLREGIVAVRIDGLTENNYVGLATHTGVSSGEVSDKQLAANILGHLTEQQKEKLSFFTCVSAPCLYQIDGQPMESRIVRLKTMICNEKNQFKEKLNFHSVLRALLGSQRRLDRAALNQFLAQPRHVEFYLSNNLEFLTMCNIKEDGV